MKKVLFIMSLLMISSIGIKAQYQAYSWGDNNYGQLGIGVDYRTPKLMIDNQKWRLISLAGGHTVAIHSDGSLWAWGNNNYGQLGNGNTLRIINPTKIDTSNNWKSVETGNRHTVAIKEDGTLWVWGYNSFGQLGDGTTTTRKTPKKIGSDTSWEKVKAGDEHTIAIKTDGSLWAWGRNVNGQLGDSTNNNKNLPTRIGNDTDWADIFVGDNYSMALKNDGSLWAWGRNNYGQLGDSSTTDRNYPKKILSSKEWACVSTSKNTYMADSSSAITYYGGHILAIKIDGTLWSWGFNLQYQLGLGSQGDKKIPTQVDGDTNWLMVAAGTIHSLAIKKDGSLWAWGKNEFGQLGDSTLEVFTIPSKIGSMTDWNFINSPSLHSIALKNDSTLFGWGYNYYGQLGDGKTVHKTLPKQLDSNTNWIDVSSKYYHTLGIKSDGSLWAWGYNNNGQLGDSTIFYKNSPKKIGNDSNWKNISTGYNHSLAIKSDGTLWAWGDNYEGQLGDSSRNDRITPKKIGNDTNWKKIVAGGYHSLGIKSDGTLWAWGANNYGQIGDNTTSDKTSPTKIGNDNNWIDVDAGLYHTLAIKSDGTLWAWGYNQSGQLGDSTNINKKTPTLIGYDSSWINVSAGAFFSIALKNDSTLWAWGNNSYGQLGINSQSQKFVPTMVGNDKDWIKIVVGYEHSLAIKQDLSLWGWGRNYFGQLGIESTTQRLIPNKLNFNVDGKIVSAGKNHSTAVGTLAEEEEICSEQPTDTDGDGYRNISTLCHLRWVSENDSSWSWNFELDNDINAADTRNWNDTLGFSPIGNDTTKFTGIFDGKEYVIDSLYINRSTQYYIGLFGYNTSSSKIINLSLKNVFVKGSAYTSALIGWNNGTISDCKIDGNIVGSNHVGPIAAVNSFSGKIYFSTTQAITKGSSNVGGIAGWNDGIIQQSFSMDSVLATGYAGGIAGLNDDQGKINNCFSLGNVFSTGSNVGGLVGYNYKGIVNTSFSIGKISGSSYKGGLIGRSYLGTITNSFWDTQTSGIDSSAGGTGKTTTQMKTQSTFTNWDFDTTWSISSQVNDGYPYLQGFGEGEEICSEEPTDTDGDGYKNISTLCHLRWVSENDSSWTWNFELDNDINAADTRNWNVGNHDNNANTPDSAMGWNPIGNSSKYFSGKFDGNGYSIDSLYINRPLQNFIGFFGYINGMNDFKQLRNLNVLNADIIGNNYVGIIAGGNGAGTYRCRTTGTVKGISYVGGFSGYSFYKNNNCISNSIVNGNSKVGGFTGQNYHSLGLISNCYSKTSVEATGQRIGGFVGENLNSSKILNCYSTGSVNANNDYVGGFLGYYSSGSIDSCFWDTETSGKTTSAGGTGKTTTQMKTQSTFTNWDFDTTWSISSQVNDGYPHLQGFGDEETGNYALYFDGTNDYITTKLMAGYNEYPIMTWELLVKPTRFDHNDRQTLLSTDNGYYDRTMLLEEDNKLSAFDGDASWHAIKADSNQWQHFAVVYAQDSIILYKNGYQIVNDYLDNNTSYTFFEIAHNPGYNEKFRGYIDEVRVWKGIRSQQEIIDNINKEIDNINDTNLVAYYNFNNFSADSLFDAKGLHNGKIVGEPEEIPLSIDTLYINPSQLKYPRLNDFTELSPKLEWFSISNASTYSVMLSTDSNFATYIIYDTTLISPEYQIESGQLSYNEKYYWKVSLNKDGKQYPWSSTWFFNTKEESDTIKIGNQVWMKRNLDVAFYRNGDTIPHIQDAGAWINATSGAWCYYNNDPDNGEIYGKLYNWYAVNDPRGLAPEGWRVASDEDWKEIELELGMTQAQADSWEFRGSPVGAKLAGGYDLWSDGVLRNDSNFNISEFTGLPSGYRYYGSGSFDYKGSYTFWWTSSENSPTAIYRGLNNGVTSVSRNYSYKNFGFPVRCIRDFTDTNLIKNPSCELPLVDGNIPYWNEVIGTTWTRGNEVVAFHGDYHFYAGENAYAELSQYVDLSKYDDDIDSQDINFIFTSMVRSYSQNPIDKAKIILEYWNSNKTTRLDTFDFGFYGVTTWTKLSKLISLPANTRWINIRLISQRYNGDQNDGYFDDLYLMVSDSVIQLATPTLVSPTNNSTNQELSLTLNWNSVTDATSYDIQLSTDSSFATTIVNANTTSTDKAVSGLSISTSYYWRARAINSADTSDWSQVWKFTTKSSGVTEPPSSWAFTDFTGSNSTVIILKNISPKIENRDFQNGDAVGFFFKRNDSLICAGYGIWNNANMAVTVWGDDSETEIKDGFASIESYTVKIWDGQLGRELNVEITYSSGNSYFVGDGISYIGFLKGVSTVTQNIYIAQGWNMISSYVNPTNDSLEVMFDDISDKLTILKNNAGQVFIPSYEINGIGKWNIEHGYKAYMSSSDTLKVTGLALQPENKPIIINSGWNIVSYIRSSAKNIEECLTTLTESGSLTIAKNNAGQVYIPSYDINSIGNMLPGQGYQMYLTAKDTLVYPANSAGRTAPSEFTPMAKYILPEYLETGNSAVLLLEIEGNNGDEIAVYNQNNQVIGSGVIHKNKASITIWGDNERTSEIDGATINDELRIMNYDYKTGRMSEVNISGLLDVVNGNNIYELNYSKDAFFVAKAKVVDNSSNLSMLVNPNPANDYIEITLEGESKYSTLMIFSNNGKQIADLTSELLTLSGNKLRYNTTNLSSGTYNLILNNGTDKIMKQIMIVK